MNITPHPTDYELGRLKASAGDKAGGRAHLEIVTSGKKLEGPGQGRKVRRARVLRATGKGLMGCVAGQVQHGKHAADEDACCARGDRYAAAVVKVTSSPLRGDGEPSLR